jgi:hypothetical protein
LAGMNVQPRHMQEASLDLHRAAVEKLWERHRPPDARGHGKLPSPNKSSPEETISVEAFCGCHGIDEAEIRQLQRLLGPFAIRNELWANIRRQPRFR